MIFIGPWVDWQLDPLIGADEANVAFTPLVRIPLDHLDKARSAAVIVPIPDDPRWSRIRRGSGDPGYLIAAFSPTTDRRQVSRQAYCFDKLGIRVEALHDEIQIPLPPAESAPYGHSGYCRTFGLIMQVSPGTEVTLRIFATGLEPLPRGELIVLPNWSNINYISVGAGINELSRQIVNLAALVGTVLFACGLGLSEFRYWQ
ncbi:MAG: hypothetical protein ACRD96_21845, partial [Bryobacteraceae bacterium]